MITKEKINEYFEQEIENHGQLIYLLYRDKKLLKEERFNDFAKELLERSKKAYRGSLALAISFLVIGVVYLLDPSDTGSFEQFAGFSYITASLIFITISTKEYFSIKGSMTMLLKLLESDEVIQPASAPELEIT
jgi:hypothetical protein